jgi:hypothetical protein
LKFEDAASAPTRRLLAEWLSEHRCHGGHDVRARRCASMLVDGCRSAWLCEVFLNICQWIFLLVLLLLLLLWLLLLLLVVLLLLLKGKGAYIAEAHRGTHRRAFVSLSTAQMTS